MIDAGTIPPAAAATSAHASRTGNGSDGMNAAPAPAAIITAAAVIIGAAPRRRAANPATTLPVPFAITINAETTAAAAVVAPPWTSIVGKKPTSAR